jgi:hypothetical protein
MCVVEPRYSLTFNCEYYDSNKLCLLWFLRLYPSAIDLASKVRRMKNFHVIKRMCFIWANEESHI